MSPEQADRYCRAIEGYIELGLAEHAKSMLALLPPHHMEALKLRLKIAIHEVDQECQKTSMCTPMEQDAVSRHRFHAYKLLLCLSNLRRAQMAGPQRLAELRFECLMACSSYVKAVIHMTNVFFLAPPGFGDGRVSR